MPSFNLVDRPWIPCQMVSSGRGEVLSLADLLDRAHEVRALSHSSPLVLASVHRLLLAVLHRALDGPRSPDDWVTLWRGGTWALPAVSDYLEKWRNGFDLFHPQRPFYQVPWMANAEPHPVALLMLEAASGNNATLFDHRHEGSPQPLSPAEAALYLLARQAYSIGFGKSQPFYFSDATLTRGLSVQVLGDNLFETLALNLLVYDDLRPQPRVGDDLPAWEQDPPASPHPAGSQPCGYVDYLTWLSRRIHLVPEDDGTVRFCQVQQNLRLAGELLDPFKCFLKSAQGGFRPLPIDPDKALWRQSATLFHPVGDQVKRPEVFSRLDRLAMSGRVDGLGLRATYRFDVFGFATDPGKAASVTFWQHDRLPLPVAFLGDAELWNTLALALSLAESIAGKVRSAVRITAYWLLFPEGDPRKAKPKDWDRVKPLLEHAAAEHLYWPNLEAPFYRLLTGLPVDTTDDGDGGTCYGLRELPVWTDALRREARHAYDRAIAAFDGSPRALKAGAKGRLALNRGLKELVPGHAETLTEVFDEST
ncbi:MAG: type I-E CRISPR-associated protein Cse1/CasA [Chloroflexota bacterium]